MIKYFILLMLIVPSISSCQNGRVSGRTYFNKAVNEYDNNSFDSAISSLNSALRITPKKDSLYAKILFLRSGAYVKLGELDSAIRDLEQLVRRQPKELDYLINLSYLYGETERFTESLAILKKAIVIDESNPSIYTNLAYYSGEAGAYDNAIKYAQKGLTLTKDSSSMGALLNSLGFAQSKIVSAEKGLQTVATSISFFPRNPFAYFNMGRIFLDKHDKEKACSNFIKARDLGGVVLTEEYIKMYCK